MPLHTSDNHDGQLTDQGIHSLWESRIPELFVNYKFNVAQLLITRMSTKRWDMINDTHSLVPALLAADKT
jgi:glutamate 5-kinase